MSYEPVQVKKDGPSPVGGGTGSAPVIYASGSGGYAASGYSENPVKTDPAGGGWSGTKFGREVKGSSNDGGTGTGMVTIASNDRMGFSGGAAAFGGYGGGASNEAGVGGPVRKISPHPIIGTVIGAIGCLLCVCCGGPALVLGLCALLARPRSAQAASKARRQSRQAIWLGVIAIGCGIALIVIGVILYIILIQQVVKVMPDEGKPCNTTASAKDTSYCRYSYGWLSLVDQPARRCCCDVTVQSHSTVTGPPYICTADDAYYLANDCKALCKIG